MKVKTKLPDVREYLDSNQYLQDVFATLKKAKPTFSYMTWAMALGLESKSYLRFAVLGERGISLDLTQRLTKFLELNEVDQEYFTLLVLYTDCENKDQKKIFGSRLLQLLKQEVAMAEADIAVHILSKPMAITIRTILSFNDIPRTTAYLSKILNVPEQVIQENLELLEKEDLASRKGNEWYATDTRIKMSDRSEGETLSYHKECLLKAIDAQTAPSAIRHFRSVGLALSEQQYQNYLKDLDYFVKKCLRKI